MTDKFWSRSAYIIVATTTLVAALLTSTVLSSSAETTQSGTSSDLLACTTKTQAVNYPTYSLGPEFEGLKSTAVLRNCTSPRPGAPPQMRSNFVSYIYGDCEPPQGEGGCPAPIEVQSWPYCERGRLDPTHHNPLHGKVDIRGVSADIFEYGKRIEIYTGQSTVMIFGTDRAQIVRAGRALVAAPQIPSEPATPGDVSSPLPASAPGALSCRP